MIKYRLPYPWMDGVYVALSIEERFLSNWNVITALSFVQNEHRPAFPVYIWAIDHAWFAADGAYVIAFNALLLLIMAGMIAAWMHGGAWTVRRIALMTAAPVAIFWPAQAQNLNWSIQVNYILSMAALIVSVYPLLAAERAARERRSSALPYIVLSALGLFVSSFSLTFGFVAWPIFVVYLLCRRADWRLPAVLLLAGAATIYLYAATWIRIKEHADPFAALLLPLPVGRYLVGLLGAPLHFLLESLNLHVGKWLHVSVGTGIFIAIVWASLRIFFERFRHAPATSTFSERGLVLIALLATACGGLIALGRHNFGAEQGLTSRYLLVGIIAWLGAIGYWLPKWRVSRSLARAGFAAMATLAAASIVSYAILGTEMRMLATLARIAAAASIHGIDEPEMNPRLYPANVRDDTLTRLNAFMRKRGHPIFAEPWFGWVGRTAADALGAAETDRCIGRIDSAARVGTTVMRVEGWAWDNKLKEPPPYIVAVDSAGVIRGIGFTGIIRRDIAKATRRWSFYQVGWIVLAGSPEDKLEIVAVGADGKTCALGTPPPRRR